MAHAQQQILNAVKTALDTGTIVASGRVFLDRDDALHPNELPAILIEEDPSGESIEPQTLNGLQLRELRVNVRVFPAPGAASAASTRELGLKVEKVLAAPTASLAINLCKGGVRLAVSRHLNSGEGERVQAARFQTWRMSYFVRAHTPDVIT